MGSRKSLCSGFATCGPLQSEGLLSRDQISEYTVVAMHKTASTEAYIFDFVLRKCKVSCAPGVRMNGFGEDIAESHRIRTKVLHDVIVRRTIS
jgi:hypothetical protein